MADATTDFDSIRMSTNAPTILGAISPERVFGRFSCQRHSNWSPPNKKTCSTRGNRPWAFRVPAFEQRGKGSVMETEPFLFSYCIIPPPPPNPICLCCRSSCFCWASLATRLMSICSKLNRCQYVQFGQLRKVFNDLSY